MNMDEPNTVSVTANAPSSNELEEEYIPNSNNTEGDAELDDVIPCEYVEIGEQQVDYNVVDSSNDGFYDNFDSYTSEVITTVSVNQIVDIAPQTVTNTTNELEEAYIPNSNNTSNDDQLDDVML